MKNSSPWFALRRCALLHRQLTALNERLEKLKSLAGRAEEKLLLMQQIHCIMSELGTLKRAGFAL